MAGIPLLDRVDAADDSVVFTWSDGSTCVVAAVWLRELCPCSACRYVESGRRRREALTTPTDLVPARVSVGPDRTAVVVDWPDHHRSEIPVEAVVTSWVRTRSDSRTTWGAELVDRLPVMFHHEIVNDPRIELAWLEAIDELGFVIVSGVPPTREALAQMTRMVGPIRPSNYEPIWSIEAVADPANEVVSASGLSPHTDLPYRQLPPGLQFLLSVVADAPGGASTLVDGHRVADEVRAQSPDDWQALTEVLVRFRFVDAETDFQLDAPVVGIQPDGSYGVIRHAPGLLAPLDPSPPQFEPAYQALRRFTELTNDPAFQVVHRLAPGEMLVFDNHRLLHGRQALDLGAGGGRHLLGAYVDRDDLASRIRVLRTALG